MLHLYNHNIQNWKFMNQEMSFLIKYWMFRLNYVEKLYHMRQNKA